MEPEIFPIAPMGSIVDTHAHYDDECFDDIRDEILSMMPKCGVKYIINNSVDCYQSAQKCLEISHKYEFCYAAIGVHPLNLEDNGPLDKDLLCRLLKNDKVVALGEIGLDYHYTPETKVQQKLLFESQLVIANELGIPVIVHDRDAHMDTLEILKKQRPMGTVHCFSGSVEMMRELIRLGLYIGIGGVITFNNAKKLVEVVRELPLDRLLIETDAPYLSPVPYRGKICNSAYLSAVVQKISEIKQCSAADIFKVSAENAQRIYRF